MTDVYWELPSRGDGRRAVAALNSRGGFGPQRPTTVATDVRPGNFGPFDELAQIVLAAELSGVDGVVAPYDPNGEESWIVAAAALRQTRHSRVVVEFHPTFGTPVYAAKMSATLQRLSAGRLEWRVKVDTDAEDAIARGDAVRGADRYARAAEFLTVARGVWNEEQILPGGFGGTGYDFDGEYYDVLGGGFRGILSGLRFPRVHLTGGLTGSSGTLGPPCRCPSVHPCRRRVVDTDHHPRRPSIRTRQDRREGPAHPDHREGKQPTKPGLASNGN